MLRSVPLFGLGNKGKSPNVCAQERVNLYAEVHEDPESGGRITLYPTPGLTQVLNLGGSPTRGVYGKGNSRYLVNGTTLWELAADGTTTNRGTLQPVTGRVDMVDNGDQLLIVDGSYGYIYTFATTTLTQISDTDFVAGDTCDFLNGFFIVQRSNSAEWGISALYDGMSWDALDFATAESDPDDLVRVFVNNGIINLFGSKTIEFWGDSGAEDFPFARIGANAIQWGLASRWSLCQFSNSALMFLGRNELGAVQVFLLVGNSIAPVSNPELDKLLSTYTVENATAFTYMVSGHPMYQISFPTDGVTWVYDGLSKDWHRAQYGQEGRHRAEIQVTFQDQSYVTDYEDGRFYLLDENAYMDDGQTIVREFVTRHIKSGDYSSIAAFWLDMEAGVGLQSGQGSNPQAMLQISRDGGHTWGGEMWRSFGAVGVYAARAVWNRLGRARDWLFKVRVTDPVKTVFVAAWVRNG